MLVILLLSGAGGPMFNGNMNPLGLKVPVSNQGISPQVSPASTVSEIFCQGFNLQQV